jgi:hypothetical protein
LPVSSHTKTDLPRLPHPLFRLGSSGYGPPHHALQLAADHQARSDRSALEIAAGRSEKQKKRRPNINTRFLIFIKVDLAE